LDLDSVTAGIYEKGEVEEKENIYQILYRDAQLNGPNVDISSYVCSVPMLVKPLTANYKL
jgi:hypothetical protein